MKFTRYEAMVQQVIDQMFEDITHTPGGYAYVQHLPKQGRSSQRALRLRWRKKVMAVVMPPRFHTALVKAALDEAGMVDTRGIALVNWLLDHLYITPHRLFEVWMQHASIPPPSHQKGQHRAG